MRGYLLHTLLGLQLALTACAGGGSGPSRFDAALDGTTGEAGPADGAVPDDTGPGPDGGMGDDAAPADGGPIRGTCEGCETHEQCGPGAYCVNLTVGGRACVPACEPDIPSCPRAFNCVLDVSSGVDQTVCLPVGGACCVDEDADGYGMGIGCDGTDCNDDDPAVNPGETERCNGADDDCDGTVDNPPTDCVSGRCTDDGDGTYTSVSGADCMAAMCASGTTVDCALYTCEDGGEDGNRCASACDPGGTDDELYCIEAAHCDGGVCEMDVPNGMACDEDSDCVSAHCDNGFCCDSGVCCGVTTDCPGGGGVTTICEDPMTCSGSRGETMCTAEFRCMTMAGIPDDSACDDTVMALDCGFYDPVYCTGEVDQPRPRCPTSCVADVDCIEAAHCEFGACVPDRPPGAPCSRNPDCMDGLSCVDGVCCTTTCTGTCEACNLPGTAGTCTPVPAGSDPSGECPGFSCSGYYTGFSGGEDVCYHRQDVSDSTATCNGARMCTTPDTLCSLQPRGAVQIDCDNTCQSPVAGTCTGMVAGSCRDLDDPTDLATCGMGECMRSVQRCVGGTPRTCTPGTPTVEICDGLDNDCNGTPDNGAPSGLCPPGPGVASTACTMGSCEITMCMSGRADLDMMFSTGCECMDDTYGNACAALTNLGMMSPGTSTTVSGFIVPDGEEDWFTVAFPLTGRGPAGGNPQIRLTGPTASNFELDFYTDCSTSISCGTGMAAGVGSYAFIDNQSSGATAYSGPHTVAWPTTVVFRVRRVVPAAVCSAAGYQVTISR